MSDAAEQLLIAVIGIAALVTLYVTANAGGGASCMIPW